MSSTPDDVTTTLVSIRDYIRWGASRFAESGIFLGHGTSSPLDEAAAIVLRTLYQPYDLADAYLDCTLTISERRIVLALLEKRITERKPSAYLTHETLFAGLSFYVDERVLVPRSPIAELIAERFDPWVDEAQVFNILDLCTGSACIAIACALAFPDAQVDASDVSDEALAVAKINVERHEIGGQINLHCSDLFNDLPEKCYDIIVSNPPYVSRAEWECLPPEYHAEPVLGLQGGDSGLDLVVRILAAAGRYISPSGILVVEVGSSAENLQERFPDVPFYWLDFEHGGDGVFLLTAEQIHDFHSQFALAITEQCLETP